VNGCHGIISQQFKPSNDGIDERIRSLFADPVALPNSHRESLRAAGSARGDLLLQKLVDMGRKSTGKRLRFEIFKRDNFTCQYCGSQPPDIVLVLDHIHPISKGGDNDPMNLITSCEPCNQGKSDKALEDKIIAPDADLEWLEMQQEIKELKRYQDARQIREDLIIKIASNLSDEFMFQSGENYNGLEVFDEVIRMLNQYDAELVEESLISTASKIKGEYLNMWAWKKYTYGILKNMAKER